MSVPYTDPVTLWAMPTDEFNEWRTNNDLPLVFSYLATRLPSFDRWLAENNLTIDRICRIVPSGELFKGGPKKLAYENKEHDETHTFYRVLETTANLFVERNAERDRSVPAHFEFEPYNCWAKRVLGRDRFFQVSPPNRSKIEGFTFRARAAFTMPSASRVSLYSDFQILKLGGINLNGSVDLGRRNLDFADLDFLTIREDWYGPWGININFSSCQHWRFVSARLHHVTFYDCDIEDMLADDSQLQMFTFVKCKTFQDCVFTNTRLYKLEFLQCTNFPSFVDCDLIEFKFEPPNFLSGKFLADQYRRLRVAFQEAGKRHEAAEFYCLERANERKALFDPYFEYSARFPNSRYGGSIRDVLRYWWIKEFSTEESLKYIGSRIWFHIRIWINPIYAVKALWFKLRWLLSAFEAILWGYGERPARVVIVAILVIAAYAFAYASSFSKTKGIFDALYFSIITFTTVGYGDIAPDTGTIKLLSASEALCGVFLMGMLIAGFSNRNRY
jgi:hypothetical protein